MSGKTLLVIFAISLAAFLISQDCLDCRIAKNRQGKTTLIVNFDKNVRVPVLEKLFSSRKFQRFQTAATVFMQENELIGRCREDPVFLGLMGLVVGISGLGIGTAVYLIRNDPRFG